MFLAPASTGSSMKTWVAPTSSRNAAAASYKVVATRCLSLFLAAGTTALSVRLGARA